MRNFLAILLLVPFTLSAQVLSRYPILEPGVQAHYHTNVPSEDVPAEFTETGYVMIVADGMGGAAGGEVARRLAIATLINIIIIVVLARYTIPAGGEE